MIYKTIQPFSRYARAFSRLFRGGGTGQYSALILPTLIYFLILFLIPLSALIIESVYSDGAFKAPYYISYISDPHNQTIIIRTIRYATLTSALCLLLGYPFARLMLDISGVMSVICFAVLLLPLSLSLIAKAFGWMILLGRHGPINDILMAAGLIDRPVRLLFTELGLIIGTVSIKLPFMVLPIYVVLKSIPEELSEAGASLGAGPVYRLIHIDLPLALPGMLAGFAFVFSQTAASYAIPSILGGPRFLVMSREIVDSYLILQTTQKGSTIAVLLLIIVVMIVALVGMITRRRARA